MSIHDPMVAMRDKLIHGYDTIDPSVVWLTITTDVPPALEKIGKLHSVY